MHTFRSKLPVCNNHSGYFLSNPEPESTPEQRAAKEILYSKMAGDEETEVDPPDPEEANQTHWKQDRIKNTVSNSPSALIR